MHAQLAAGGVRRGAAGAGLSQRPGEGVPAKQPGQATLAQGAAKQERELAELLESFALDLGDSQHFSSRLQEELAFREVGRLCTLHRPYWRDMEALLFAENYLAELMHSPPARFSHPLLLTLPESYAAMCACASPCRHPFSIFPALLP